MNEAANLRDLVVNPPGFETTTSAMTTIRQWSIEKSTDLQSWTPLQTVALSGSSPIIIPDSGSVKAPVCYYRAVQVEDVFPGISPGWNPIGVAAAIAEVDPSAAIAWAKSLADDRWLGDRLAEFLALFEWWESQQEHLPQATDG